MVSVSDLARRTRELVERLVREPAARLLVMRNNRPVAVLSGIEADLDTTPGAAGAQAKPTRLLDMLLAKSGVIRSLAAAHGVRSAEVFGSVARGDERPESDIDFMVDLAPGRNLIDLIAFGNDLEDLLGRKVDVVTKRSLKPAVAQAAIREAVRIV